MMEWFWIIVILMLVSFAGGSGGIYNPYANCGWESPLSRLDDLEGVENDPELREDIAESLIAEGWATEKEIKDYKAGKKMHEKF